MNRLFICLLVFSFLSCKHDKILIPALPEITIDTPIENQHFAIGETISITGTITSSRPLAEVGVHMTDKATDNEFFHNHYGVGNTNTYRFSATHVVVTNSKTVFEVEVEAIDADGNTSEAEIDISIN